VSYDGFEVLVVYDSLAILVRNTLIQRNVSKSVMHSWRVALNTFEVGSCFYLDIICLSGVLKLN